VTITSQAAQVTVRIPALQLSKANKEKLAVQEDSAKAVDRAAALQQELDVLKSAADIEVAIRGEMELTIHQASGLPHAEFVSCMPVCHGNLMHGERFSTDFYSTVTCSTWAIDVSFTLCQHVHVI
jgi:hypothetical protein